MIKAIHIPSVSLGECLEDRGIRPGADTGTPRISALDIASTDGVRIGVWQSEEGGWPVTDRIDVEICFIVDGSARITDAADGTSFEVYAGDLLVLPVGWSGRWDIGGTARKVFAILPAEALVAVPVE